MAKRQGSAYMTAGEQIAGVVFLVIYILVLPWVTDPIFDFAGRLLGTGISAHIRNLIYYYTLFAVTVLIFHGFLGRTCRNFFNNAVGTAKYLFAGLVGLYGLNELVFRVTNVLMNNHVNLNNAAISAEVHDAPRTTFLILVLLAPFVEEVLFRGLVFGNLKGKSWALAYVVSCGLFALFHLWQFVVVHQSVTYFIILLQYLVPGAVLAWVYDRTGTLWTSIFVHAAANALAVWVSM